ncbi:hypothetical protein UFOVP1261_26 [uncultured Caudovirales phage]|uniref:Uncharacterized protein n=1 Tax=uncultured Caudovirales phage TaxID=2100421 RepID=A0A6J5RJ18_9CAUD|nr:hypothetical protein UFOVP1261_26 [uncultured Caudovirales phage]CAB4221962.1 hypothetical protein UFOVP1650_14 [uncultured Caudovirales phage]
MATGNEVLAFLIPNGGWYIAGDEFEGIQFLECAPITKAQFEAGFEQCDAWKIEQEKQTKAKVETILAKLGITADELRQVLS